MLTRRRSTFCENKQWALISQTTLFLAMIFLDEIKEVGNHQSFSIYLVLCDIYICVPSYFNDENFTIYFVELMPGRSRLHTSQKLVFLFFSVVEKPFFFLLFLRLFITDIPVFIFIIMQKVEVKFTKQNAEKPDTFLTGEQKSLRRRLLVHVSL